MHTSVLWARLLNFWVDYAIFLNNFILILFFPFFCSRSLLKRMHTLSAIHIFSVNGCIIPIKCNPVPTYCSDYCCYSFIAVVVVDSCIVFVQFIRKMSMRLKSTICLFRFQHRECIHSNSTKLNTLAVHIHKHKHIWYEYVCALVVFDTMFLWEHIIKERPTSNLLYAQTIPGCSFENGVLVGMEFQGKGSEWKEDYVKWIFNIRYERVILLVYQSQS